MSSEADAVVKVLYDYAYSDDTGQIEIKAGDVYRLIKKFNNEWWQVVAPFQADEDFFFVPAHYVEIIQFPDSDKKATYGDDSFESLKTGSENSEEDAEILGFKRLDLSENVISKGKLGEGDDGKNNRGNVNSPSLPHNSPGEYANLDQYREAAGIRSVISEDIASSRVEGPPPPTLAKPSRVPWEVLQRTAPPLPENGTFVRAQAKDLPWDIYKDHSSGRLYYVNRETGERLWKPPRKTIVNTDQLVQSSLPTASSSAVASEGRSDTRAEYDQVKEENGTNISIQKGTQDRDRSQGTVKVLNPPWSTHSTTSTASLHLQTFEKFHGGYFYKTKILDAGKKKVKKSWAQIYVVVQGSNLVFYKDQKAAIQKQGTPSGKPEAVVSLLGANIDLNPKELTSKKNTISLRAAAGNIYLFHSDSEKENLEWFTRMKIVADNLSPIGTSPKDSDVQEVKREKGMIRSSSADDSISPFTPVHNFERTRNTVRIKAKLYNLISRRPTQEDLYKRGIIKDSVFGSRLHELCDREQVNVPNFVHWCIAAVESKGISHDGLYRISGNMAEIQRLRCTVDTCDTYNLYDQQWDINVLTGGLKLFFRELKEPVFTFRLHERFIDAIKIESSKERMSAFKSAVSDLPRCNHATLKELFQHLLRVINASHRNRMQSQNIAIVFGPTLLWQLESLEVQATNAIYQNKIVEFILEEYHDLFD